MVAGVPCMCIRTTGTPSRAHRGSIAASAMPAETSFTTSAPAPSAARATSAFIVSTEIGTRTAARTAPSTGSRRRRSSPPGTAIAPGRVDSAPTSSARAPAATISAAASAARAGSRWRPPSENESGVAFRMPRSATRSSASGPERVWSTGPASPAGAREPASGRGCSRAPEATVLAPVLPHDVVDLGAIEHLALEQRLGHLVEHLDVAAEQQLGALVGLHDDAPHLGIDLHRGRLRVVDALGEVAAEEDLLLLLAEGDGPELLAHAPLADHLVRELVGALEVVACKARRVPCEQLDVDVLGDRHPLRVSPQDALAALDVGPRHDDAAVEAAGAQQRRVEHVGPVGGGDQDDALVRLEAVHLDEELVERLLALVVPTAEASAAVPPDGVNFIDEDDTWCVFLSLNKEI